FRRGRRAWTTPCRRKPQRQPRMATRGTLLTPVDVFENEGRGRRTRTREQAGEKNANRGPAVKWPLVGRDLPSGRLRRRISKTSGVSPPHSGRTSVARPPPIAQFSLNGAQSFSSKASRKI